MRIALLSFGAGRFSALHATCVAGGHLPVTYVYSRSGKPRTATDPDAAETASRILQAMPPGTDLLLPGSAEGLGKALSGYDLDLAVSYGFPWKIPPQVLSIPRFGFINIHSSLLPKYRGPAPALWAIRNGDPDIGMTIHRMDEDFDTGPILAQRGGVPLDDDVTRDRLWSRIEPVVRDLLAVALEQVVAGAPGEPQRDEDASYAGLMGPEFSSVDWSRTAHEIHNQVRTFRFMGAGRGPTARVGERHLKLLRTRLTPGNGHRVECADAPIWIVESEPAKETPDAR